MNKTLRLAWGIHNGTFTSRDSDIHIEVNNIDEARQEVRKLQEQFAPMGYILWFATLYDGVEVVERLAGNSNYENMRPFTPAQAARISGLL